MILQRLKTMLIRNMKNIRTLIPKMIEVIDQTKAVF